MEKSKRTNNDLLRSMRKEIDEIKNAMKEKTTENLDEMVKKDRFSFHNQGSGMPLAAKILPSTT